MQIRICFVLHIAAAVGSVLPQRHLKSPTASVGHREVSTELFNELEEFSRIIDISYCVGSTSAGIQKPFECASRCSDFEHFELVTLLSDSCGYVALSHAPTSRRILLAFRGTYSVANTVADLSTIPQEYAPYPGDDEEDIRSGLVNLLPRDVSPEKAECANCTVHMGFMRSWQNTKPEVVPVVEELLRRYPEYRLTLVGHSLGGAVATLASLDFHGRGWNPKLVTFGEPRVGNEGLAEYIDKAFAAGDDRMDMIRVTHVDDPVPLLPLTEGAFDLMLGRYIFQSQSYLPKFRISRSVKAQRIQIVFLVPRLARRILECCPWSSRRTLRDSKIGGNLRKVLYQFRHDGEFGSFSSPTGTISGGSGYAFLGLDQKF
ncbi:uncharacterized protein KY384_009101 [Bacidia gigantensis]|uniref:uncharacterized protein n=1 Tax=Bacidia gigantensis TaxID=2732470 RepID=UPI001D05B264|nr:uncharacterized protein KY384_009101 [Bacidia gigantensis]KAG8525457.1 hypothetical protein KY384_009101 [Bacidia gigantensis]